MSTEKEVPQTLIEEYGSLLKAVADRTTSMFPSHHIHSTLATMEEIPCVMIAVDRHAGKLMFEIPWMKRLADDIGLPSAKPELFEKFFAELAVNDIKIYLMQLWSGREVKQLPPNARSRYIDTAAKRARHNEYVIERRKQEELDRRDAAMSA